eukprot:6492356-Amphidinium_carterae.1
MYWSIVSPGRRAQRSYCTRARSYLSGAVCSSSTSSTCFASPPTARYNRRDASASSSWNSMMCACTDFLHSLYWSMYFLSPLNFSSLMELNEVFGRWATAWPPAAAASCTPCPSAGAGSSSGAGASAS